MSSISLEKIPDITEYVRNKFINETGITSDELKNPLGFAEKIDKNIILIRFPSSCDSLSGFYQKISEYSCIYINSSHTLGRQYTSFWHEYYHAIDDTESDNTETLANEFAFCMLLPETALRSHISSLSKNLNDLTIEDLVSIQYRFRTSLSLLISRLNAIYNVKLFNKFYSFTSLNERKSYLNIIKSLNLSSDLISPTNDFILPKRFINCIKYNIENDLISTQKVNILLDLFEEKGVHFK